MKTDISVTQRRLELHRFGLDDTQIAKRTGVTRSAIGHWRRKAGLPTNRASGGHSTSRKEEDLRRSLHRQGWADVQIAKAAGITPTAMLLWRVSRGLPINSCDLTLTHLHPAKEERRAQLYRLGKSDREIATDEGAKRGAISHWRRARGLPRNDGKRLAGPISVVSMDADLGEVGFNRHALVADDAASAWLEENGSTVW